MESTIQIKFFATLMKFLPDNAGEFPIEPGVSVAAILDQLGVPAEQTKLIFIDGRRGRLDTLLHGGERVGIFPPVGGG